MTRANVAVHLDHRRQANTGVREWRIAVEELEPDIEAQLTTPGLRLNPKRADAMRWLLGRLEPEWRAMADIRDDPNGFPAVAWDGLILAFVTPHAVDWCTGYRDEDRGGRLNLAMNLQEIIDMVRWAVEGE